MESNDDSGGISDDGGGGAGAHPTEVTGRWTRKEVRALSVRGCEQRWVGSTHLYRFFLRVSNPPAKKHELFLQGIKLYGKEWKSVAGMVKTRTVVQTRTHAQVRRSCNSRSVSCVWVIVPLVRSSLVSSCRCLEILSKGCESGWGGRRH